MKVFLISLVFAAAASGAAFDVASVKLNTSGTNGGKIDGSGSSRIIIENTSLLKTLL